MGTIYFLAFFCVASNLGRLLLLFIFLKSLHCFNSNVFSYNPNVFLREMCDPGEPTEETRTLLGNSEGIHEFILSAEETYNLDDESVFTDDNIEHLADKILDEYEICLESRFIHRLN